MLDLLSRTVDRGYCTDLARSIRHGANDSCVWADHFAELLRGDTRENADEQLLTQGFLHSWLAEDCMGQLRFAAVGAVRCRNA